jgi:hypothetical protein
MTTTATASTRTRAQHLFELVDRQEALVTVDIRELAAVRTYSGRSALARLAFMSADKPLTRADLARLLRVAANLLETSAANEDADSAPITGVRTRRRKDFPPPSELAQARARRALKKFGLLP